MRFPRVLFFVLSCALIVSGCNRSPAKAVAQLAPAPTPTVTVAPPVVVTPAVIATTASPTPSPRPKPPSYDVKAVQRQLTALHYYVGAVDGQPGPELASAVMAFQKVQGLSADGGVGKFTLAALKSPVQPKLKGTGGGTRVEVDLTKQVLYVVKDAKVTRILPISSGNGAHYATKQGGKAVALTPVGYYTIERRILGAHKADLGILYDPQYFYRGWAIHGSNSVPAYPASHGCIRVTRLDAKFLLGQIGVGTAVYIYGGRYVFTAGSSAPGTSDPGGDTAVAPAPKPTPSPTASPTPTTSPTPSPTASPSPTTVVSTP